MNSQVYDLPFDQFQRYFALNSCVKSLKERENLESLTVLDVGGHPGVICDFLTAENITVLDMKPVDRTNYIQGDACAMPLGDESFQIVTALDVFEHIVPEKRAVFLNELSRVASDYIILGGPFLTEEVSLAEKILYEFAYRVLGKTFTGGHPLKEHIENGLPPTSFLIERIEEKGYNYVTFPSGHLYNWLFMNLVKHFIFTIPESDELQQMLDKFYNLHLSARDGGVPSYRTFFVISKKQRGQILNEIPEPAAVTEGFNDSLYKLQLLHLYFTLFELEAKRELKVQKEYTIHLETLLNQKETLMNQKNLAVAEVQGKLDLTEDLNRRLQADLERKRIHLIDLQRHADNLESSLNKIKQTIAYKLYRKLVRR